MKKLCVLCGIGLAIASCGGGEEPSVEIVQASPSAIVTADDTKDDLSIVVRYGDPNGDLGGGVARVHDCRSATLVSHIDIPPIANQKGVDEGIEIEGDLELLLPDVGAIAAPGVSAVCDEAGAAAGAFCVVLVDAAGNESAPACTDPIAIE